MGARVEVPITPGVLEWALRESGLSESELAEAAEVDAAHLRRWLSGQALPSVTELRTVASQLHRQFATFLLPAPPGHDLPHVAFRQPLGGRARPLNPDERRYLRRASRLQSAHRWLAEELRSPLPAVRSHASGDPEVAAADFRRRLDVSLDEQQSWSSVSRAFDGWRSAVERLGVLVTQYPMGDHSCRGFSLWDDRAPLIAINTTWPDEARIFTLFHEAGHLVTRTNSACAQPTVGKAPTNAIERWCERFAAAVAIPPEALAATRRVTSLGELSRLARTNRVSVRAMALRLVELDKASWALYRAIPAAAEMKVKAAGGTGRTTREIREDEVGWRGIEVFIDAAKREVISRSQALDYLEISAVDFDTLAADASLR